MDVNDTDIAILDANVPSPIGKGLGKSSFLNLKQASLRLISADDGWTVT